MLVTSGKFQEDSSKTVHTMADTRGTGLLVDRVRMTNICKMIWKSTKVLPQIIDL